MSRSRILAGAAILVIATILTIILVVDDDGKASVSSPGRGPEHAALERSIGAEQSNEGPSITSGTPARQQAEGTSPGGVGLEASDASVDSEASVSGDSSGAQEKQEKAALDAKYRHSTLEELVAVEARLSKALEEGSQPEFRWRSERGLGEFLGTGNSLNVTDHDPLEVSAYVFLPRGEAIYKVVLPREEFPELYQIKRELVWVRDTLRERTRVATVR